MNFLRPITFIAILAIISGCVARVSEKALIRPTAGEKLTNSTSVDGRWAINSLDLPREDGVTLYAAQFSRPDARALVLYFGGNGYTISRFHQRILDVYAPHPVDVLIVDHRGYGGSSGVASLDALMKDAVQTYDFARAMSQYKGKPIIVHGQSLGSFLAGEVAKNRALDALVLESSATTAEDWVQGFVDNSMLVRRAVVEGSLKGRGNLEVMSTLDEPMLIVVGKNDKTTRSEMSSQLYAAAKVDETRKELLIVSDAGHNDAARGKEYKDAFERLLTKIKR
jgi:uncharacterized protein